MKIYQHQSKIHLRIKIENVNQYQPMPKSININQDQYRRQSIPTPISINTNKLESTSFSNNLDQYQNQINIKINISVKSISISQFISVSKLMSMSISISITINTASISINQNKANQWIKALLDSDFVFTICLAFDCSWKCPARQDITTLLHLKLQYSAVDSGAGSKPVKPGWTEYFMKILENRNVSRQYMHEGLKMIDVHWWILKTGFVGLEFFL